MKRDVEYNRAALALEEGVNGPARARIEDYLARTGLQSRDFAQRLGYSEAAMRLFLSGAYHNIAATARQLVAKAAAYIDQHPIAPLTRITGDLYETTNVRIIQETFEKLLPKPVAYMIYAPPGSQKSFVLKHQVAKLNLSEMANETGRRAFYIYGRLGISPRDLVRRIAIACGCRVSNQIDVMLAGIHFQFLDRRVLLVVDEAQHLSIDCYETLRELLDEPPYFSLLFAGSHDLKSKFDKFSATLEQWNSRIIAKVRLPGLKDREAQGIIEREIGDLLSSMDSKKAAAKMKQLIATCTVRDAFEGSRTYINVRTLTNALDQVKAADAGRRTSTQIEEVA